MFGLKKIFETIEFFVDKGVDVSRVDEKEKELRLSICENCPQFMSATRQCGICKCFVDAKAALIYDPVLSLSKAEKVIATCPKKLW